MVEPPPKSPLTRALFKSGRKNAEISPFRGITCNKKIAIFEYEKQETARTAQKAR